MKRLTAVLLALILSVSVISFAEDSIPELSLDELNELYVSGIIDEISPEDISYKKVVTRAEFAGIISKVLAGISDGYVSDNVIFSDVSSEHEYFNEIMFVVKSEYMRGYEDGKFRPDNEIQRNEVIKTVVSMLGYDYLAKAYGEYPTGYLVVAKNLGLTSGIAFDYEDYILKDEILNIVLNSLDVPLAMITGVGTDGNIYETVPGKTIRSEYMSMYKEKGLITANELVAIKGKKAPEGYITANENLLLKISDFSQMDYLGYNTEFIYYYNEQKDINELRYIYKTDKNEVLVINRRDFKNVRSDSSVNYVDYEENDMNKTAKIAKNAVYIKNGELVSNPLVTEFSSVTSGEFTLLSTNDSSVYDIVIIKTFTNMLVGSVNISDYTVFEKYSTGNSLKLDPAEKTIVIKDADGNTVDFSYITPMSIITVCAGSEYYEVYVSKKTVSGVVDSKDSKAWEISGESYYLAPNEADSVNLSNVKFNAKVYLNFKNEIVFAENASEEAVIAYLMKVTDKSDVADQKVIAKLFLPETGKIVTYNFASKVAVDETPSITDPRVIVSTLNYESQRGQLIKIRLNDKDEITSVDTPELITDLMAGSSDGFCMSGRDSYTYMLNTKSFNNMGYIGEHTYFYNIPASMSTTEAADFSVADTRSPYMQNNANYEVNMYYNSKNDVNPVFVAAYTDTLATLSGYLYPAVFEKMTETVDANGEKTYKIYYVSQKKGTAVLSKENTAGIDFFKSINPGDMFMYATRINGEIANQKTVYSTATGNIGSGYSELVGNSQRITKRKVSEVTSDYITTTDTAGNGFERHISGFKIITVKQKKYNGEVKSAIVEYGSFADIAINNYVVLYTRGGIHECMVVYK